jgi:hypothetical protein
MTASVSLGCLNGASTAVTSRTVATEAAEMASAMAISLGPVSGMLAQTAKAKRKNRPPAGFHSRMSASAAVDAATRAVQIT